MKTKQKNLKILKTNIPEHLTIMLQIVKYLKNMTASFELRPSSGLQRKENNGNVM